MCERPRSERLLAGNFNKPNHGRGTTGRGRKWTLISLPRAKPARFCRRASNCSVTGPMIGRQPLTPTYTNPPVLSLMLLFSTIAFSARVPPARKSRARGTCPPAFFTKSTTYLYRDMACVFCRSREPPSREKDSGSRPDRPRQDLAMYPQRLK